MEKQAIAHNLLLLQGSLSVSSFAQKQSLSVAESSDLLSSLINNNGIFGIYTEYSSNQIKLVRYPQSPETSALFGITLTRENNLYKTDHESKLEAMKEKGLVYFPTCLAHLPQPERHFYKQTDEIQEHTLKGILSNKSNNTQKSVMFTPVKEEPAEKRKIVSTPHPIKLKEKTKGNDKVQAINDIFTSSLYIVEENTEIRGPLDNLIKRKLVDCEKDPKKRFKTQKILFPFEEKKKIKQASLQVKNEVAPKPRFVKTKENPEITDDKMDEDPQKIAQTTMMSFIIKNR